MTEDEPECRHDNLRSECLYCTTADKLVTARQRIAELERDAEIYRDLNKHRSEVIDELCLAESRITALEAERDAWKRASDVECKRADDRLNEVLGLNRALQAARGALEAAKHEADAVCAEYNARIDTFLKNGGTVRDDVYHELNVQLNGAMWCAQRVTEVVYGALAALDGTPGEEPCPTCGEVVPLSESGAEHRRKHRPATPAAPLCAPHCGQTCDQHLHYTGSDHFYDRVSRCFCTMACRDAGKPLHPHPTAMSLLEDRIEKALAVAFRWGETDSDHHKKWVIDQMVRALTGCPWDPKWDSASGASDEYRAWVERRTAPDGPGGEEYGWDEGIPP